MSKKLLIILVSLIVIGAILTIMRKYIYFILVMLVVCLIIYFICKVLIFDGFSNFFSKLYYSEKSMELPEEFSRVNALLSNRDYDNALIETDKLLKEKPQNTAIQLKKVIILHDFLKRKEDAQRYAVSCMTPKILTDDHEKMLMIAVDVCLGNNDQTTAVKLMNQALPRFENDLIKKNINKRLQYLS